MKMQIEKPNIPEPIGELNLYEITNDQYGHSYFLGSHDKDSNFSGIFLTGKRSGQCGTYMRVFFKRARAGTEITMTGA